MNGSYAATRPSRDDKVSPIFPKAHGDVLDGRIRRGTNLEKFGAAAYALLPEADVLYNRLRESLGRTSHCAGRGGRRHTSDT